MAGIGQILMHRLDLAILAILTYLAVISIVAAARIRTEYSALSFKSGSLRLLVALTCYDKLLATFEQMFVSILPLLQHLITPL